MRGLQAGGAQEGSGRMTGRSRAAVVAMMLWWAFFGGVSLSWALGSRWLVDTAVQGEGLLRPDVIRVPRWTRPAFGWVSGALLIAYGLIGSAGAVPPLLAGQTLSRYGWWRLLLWMPHFWVGGVLVLAATAAYLRWSRSASAGPAVPGGSVG